MADTIKFEDRELLYGSLVKDLNLKKIIEEQRFENYTVTFSVGNLLIKYNNDRFQLLLYVASVFPPIKWHAFIFVKRLITGAEKLNVDEGDGFGLESILKQNEFLKDNFDKISELFDQKNHRNTSRLLSDRLKAEFIEANPGVVKGT
ncbi:MAG: hypothetical protein JWR50_2611 [Mucilaginibacter sp.]|nr:hypothetical protein [Mucilaginibacter sp.]